MKQEKGITLIALSVTIIVLLIILGVSNSLLSGEKSTIKEAKENTSNAQRESIIQKIEADLYTEKVKLGRVPTEAELINLINEKGYGIVQNDQTTGENMLVTTTEQEYKINFYEIIGWGNKVDTSGALAPVLKDGMQAISFTMNGIERVVMDTSKNDWYSYEKQLGRTDTYNEETGEYGTSHWANAKLNGNYYVWIPRYAYKIDKSVEYETQGGGTSYKIDVIFIDKENKKEDGAEIEGLITDYAEVSDTKNATTNYILHPAFTFGEETLSGIWVGKYETSGTQNAPTVLPNKTATADLTVSQMFDMAKKVITSEQETNLDAHMLKNIEWGAVAYLAQSQYGRNGTEISVNQSSQKITGAGKKEGTDLIYGGSYYSTDPTSDQKYNGKIGKLSSTTGNIYGIYDMSGGVNEYVMGLYGTSENTPSLGSTGFTTETIPEPKYYDLYINKTKTDSSNIGDALYETKGWNGDYASFVFSNVPVFIRGSNCDNTNIAGIFYFTGGSGTISSKCGFRVCIAVNE